MKHWAILAGGSALFWFLVGVPARHWLGDSAAIFLGVALLLCLVPTAATMVWARWSLRQSPEQQLLMVLGGTGLRMFFVLAAGLIIYFQVPYFQEQSFWIWVLVAYLFSLGLEMSLVLGSPTNLS
jgi:hypothetical protein